MATVQARASYSLVDSNGTTGSEVFYLLFPDTTTLAEMNAQWATTGALLDAASGCAITGGSVALTNSPAGGWKGTPADDSLIEQTGVLNFRTATGVHRFGQAIPGIIDAALGAGGRIDLENAAVAALKAAIVATGGTALYANFAGQALHTFVDAVTSFRKRRKQLARTSAELA